MALSSGTIKKIYLTAMAALIILLLSQLYKESAEQREGYRRTYRSSLRGKITDMDNNKSSITFEIDKKARFIFVQSYESYLQNDIAKLHLVGDSVWKASLSDELHVTGKGKTYVIRMNKPK